jgi:hypothetical protein
MGMTVRRGRGSAATLTIPPVVAGQDHRQPAPKAGRKQRKGNMQITEDAIRWLLTDIATSLVESAKRGETPHIPDIRSLMSIWTGGQ